MRSKSYIVQLRILAALLALAIPLYAQTSFALKGIVVPRPATDQASSIFIEINASGPPPAIDLLQDRAKWQVFVTEIDRSVLQILNFTPTWIAETQKIKITFDKAQIGGRDPRLLAWGVIFFGVMPNLTANREALPKQTKLVASKGKDDAAIYLFGSFLTGVSTKPIYVIDAKLNWLVEIPSGESDPNTGKKGGSGWFAGVKASISTNTDAKPPADRTRVDPDSIEGALSISHLWTPKNSHRNQDDSSQNNNDRFCKLVGIDFDFRPIGGEFARKFPASSILTKGSSTFIFAPKKIAEKLWVTLYPSIGYELGKNLNQPRRLFNKPVDLTDWNAIGRITFPTKAGLYKLRPKPKDGDVYTFSIDAIYQPRIPLTREPFVTTEFINGKREPVVRLRKNARHQVEVGMNWNFSTFVGIRTQYRYGSLPPLFQFVDHQATIGLVFKAKQANSAY